MAKQIKSIVYGEGGFDDSKPNNNVVETIYFTNAELEEFNEAKAKAAEKQALLDRLGITEEQAKLLLS
jgi:hypothetical protein